MIVDLSVPVVNGMPVYPGDPEVEIAPALTVAAEGVNVLGLHLGSQSGTHVDAPFHIDDALPTLDDLPLERFLGPAAVLDVRGLPPRSPVTAGMLETVAGRLRPGTVLLVATGWDEHWGTPEYLAHPYLAAETARLIAAAGVRTVGIDALSVDPTSRPAGDDAAGASATGAAGAIGAAGEPGGDLPAHRALCGAHAVIAENLRNLDPLLEAQAAGRPIEVSLFPLRLAGADGAPVRAVARIGGV
ncbi:cyclase family protein [Microbispora sp. NPDC088329]|uniref:cyclase family protein n=1 Tax=Microbispora sp. NPDC088329 TaxID=3154869 RepID=UPI00342EBDC3